MTALRVAIADHGQVIMISDYWWILQVRWSSGLVRVKIANHHINVSNKTINKIRVKEWPGQKLPS